MVVSNFHDLGNFLSGPFNWICRSVQSEKSALPMVNELDLENYTKPNFVFHDVLERLNRGLKHIQKSDSDKFI